MPVSLRRTAVGRGGRYLPGWLRMVRPDRLPRILCRESGSQCARIPDPIRHLRAELRPGERAHVFRSRRVHRRSAEEQPARRGALHAALPLLLCMAQAWRLPTPDEREGSRHAALGAEVQSVRSLLQGPHQAGYERTEAVLRRSFRGVLPRKACLVMAAENDEAPAKPLALAILTDLHFWVPFIVLLFGIGVLVVCARN